MVINFKYFFLLLFSVMSVCLSAQIDGHNKKQFSVVKKSPEAEEKTVTALYKLYNSGDEKKALKNTKTFLKNATYPTNISSAILLQAYYYNKRDLLDSANYYTNQALKYSNKITNDSLKNRLLCLGYNLLGLNYKKQGLFDLSKKWHLKGLDVSQKYKETNLYYTNLHGLATCYKALRDNKNALKLYKECLDYKKDEEITLGSYINIGDIYSDLEEYEKANYYYNKGKQLSEKTNNKQAEASITLSIGVNYQLQQKTDDAIKAYNEVISITDKNELNRFGLIARENIGDTYIDLKKYKEAKDVFSHALQKAIHFGYLDNQAYCYDELKKIAVLQEDYKSAFDYLTKSTKVKDSISKIEQAKEIKELEIKYKTAQREKEIRFLQLDNTTKKLKLEKQEEAIENMNLQEEISQKITENTILFFQNSSQKKLSEISLLKKDQQLKSLQIKQEKETKLLTVFGFLIVLIPIIGLLLQYYKRLKTQRLLNIQQAEISSQNINNLLKDQELKLIKAAISGQDKERQRISQELHDSIGGNLAAIKLQLNHLVISNSPKIKNLTALLDETYQQVRNLSHTLIPKKFTHHKFCEVLESYFNNIGEASNIKTDFTVYPKKEIDALNEEIQIEIFKIIQELLTNTIKHAKASKIDLQLNLIENVLNILFEDNGIGFNPENYKPGIGFINLENRIAKLNGSFVLDSKPKRGTIANIEIPVLLISNTENDITKGINVKKQLDNLTKL
ncbi:MULTISPECIES: histidine kinase [Flavobacterium]|uniref:histidine kinase n=1 Tax=Flavobacterium salmonis TaxID=2654844 RepID=A0A6V6ZAQ9_9FLAO|nr:MULTISPECIES: histidine kinase [Flavobacterium]OOV16663.1 histidine kinase [Flavobacterium sp. LM4]CAD0008840.1 histidine kinase [Flavobacterium salmonis]